MAPSSTPRSGARPGLVAAGLILGAFALFLTPLSVREICTAFARDGFVRDELELGHYSQGRSPSITGRMLSTGEVITTRRTYLVGEQKLGELRDAGAIEGYRAPVWYLPAQGGLWYYADRVNEFRVQSPDEFDLGFSPAVLAINIGLFAAAAFFVRRGIKPRNPAAEAVPSAIT